MWAVIFNRRYLTIDWTNFALNFPTLVLLTYNHYRMRSHAEETDVANHFPDANNAHTEQRRLSAVLL